MTEILKAIGINMLENLALPMIVGIVIYILGQRAISNKVKSEAIRELMTYRGDYASSEFRRALNKVSVTFHKDEEIRQEVRKLYEVINSNSSESKTVERSIVGLIYKLCQKNGFKGLTEYDIDQAFPESKQTPEPMSAISLFPSNSKPSRSKSAKSKLSKVK